VKSEVSGKEQQMKIQHQTLCLGVALAASLCAGSAFAESMKFTAALTGTEEVPPTKSKGVGAIDATYDSTSKKLTWKGTYSGLSAAPTAAHFHGPAEKGKNAGVAVPAPVPASPFEGSAVLTDTQATDLLAGKIYFNVHTAASPDGEIRGQLTKAK
jgi:hypothetical protein